MSISYVYKGSKYLRAGDSLGTEDVSIVRSCDGVLNGAKCSFKSIDSTIGFWSHRGQHLCLDCVKKGLSFKKEKSVEEKKKEWIDAKVKLGLTREEATIFYDAVHKDSLKPTAKPVKKPIVFSPEVCAMRKKAVNLATDLMKHKGLNRSDAFKEAYRIIKGDKSE